MTINPSRVASLLAAAALFVSPASAQHEQVSAVKVDPVSPNLVWVCNRDHNTVSVIDTTVGTIAGECRVGVRPRTLAFSPDGTRVFVACQRGGIPLQKNFVVENATDTVGLGFNASDIRAMVAVINKGTMTLETILTDVGTEPYGVAVSPNGKYLVVSGMRSGTMKFFDPVTLNLLLTFQYDHDTNHISLPLTINDVDSNHDGLADTKDPRGFVIRDNSQQIYVTHNKSPFISVLDVALDGFGVPTAVTLNSKIDTNEYPFHPITNPVNVQTIQSQGVPRFLEDVALSPDGTRALVPHVLHNVNHDVNFDFTTVFPAFAGDFSNRVYPALTMIDASANSYNQGGDTSNRLHHELTDPESPAEVVSFGTGKIGANGMYTAGALGEPLLGGSVDFHITGLNPNDVPVLLLGTIENTIDMGPAGTQYLDVRRMMAMPGNTVTWTIPNMASFDGLVVLAQVMTTNTSTNEVSFSQGLKVKLGTQGYGTNNMGHRAGQPSRVLYSPDGNHALMLNRGSEDVFLYDVSGSNMNLVDVFPKRFEHVERIPLDKTTPMGDIPLGMDMVDDPSTTANDALLYVINEGTRTLSQLRVNFDTGTIMEETAQVDTTSGPEPFSDSVLLGQEIFEDASRAQTTGNFNNSCASCHFEGGEDANVWQRPAGPRSTMPVYGGTVGTGLILWKGVRVNMGETGPMFGGENGGHGIFTDAEQQALTDYHEIIPFPINPNLSSSSDYSPLAAVGKDLYFATNESGTNPLLRHANCAECHPDTETNPLAFPGPRFYTIDFLDPALTAGETLEAMDPDCFALRENIVQINIRDVNTGVNVDLVDNVTGFPPADGIPDVDRNFDGFDDFETYTPLNPDGHDDFKRDDPNSYLCPCPGGLNCDVDNFRIFTRAPTHFSVPTKLGAWSTPPYFHDHSVYSLRMLLDPERQTDNASQYGNSAMYPGLLKVFNDVHDIRGHEQFVPNVSKVQNTLISGSPAQAEADLDAILAYIESL